jgi:subfamily B ATP-binding cassette protein MsbA
MDAFLRLLRYARPHTGLIAGAVVAMVVYGAASAALAWLIKPIVDEVLPSQDRLGFVISALLIAYFFKGLGAYFSSYLMDDIGQRVVLAIRNQLFRHLLDQSAAFFARRTTGQLLSRINNDVGQVQRAVAETVGDLARESLALVGYAGLLFYYDAKLALVCMTAAPLVVYPLVRLGKRVRTVTRWSQEAQEHMSHVAGEAFAGHRIVKAFGAEEREAGKFAGAARSLYRSNMKVTRVLSILPPMMELLGGVAIAGALWAWHARDCRRTADGGRVHAVCRGPADDDGPIKKLSRVNANLQQAVAASERIFELLDTHTEVRERPGAEPLPPFKHAIEFEGVGFGYEDGHGRNTLRGVSVTVRAGQMIAIGPERRRQDHAGEPAAAVLRRDRGPDSHRRPGHPRRDVGVAARSDRHRDAGHRAL